ncbi:unnamed protein product [Cladocopium goreaui]|uniref:Endonuclease/exonuclease/phosphatase domain-containing protein n=1 Tax=Cladocopium goreaui TaxID=2562237 RepID=A0A9P1D128_9DINO|nr:unnamed protein product [Cladocopium goreaui]
MVFKILFLFAIFLCEDQYDFSKAQVAAPASQGETTLALAQARNQDPGQETAAKGVWCPTKPSFERSSISTLGSCRDGRIRCRLEMHSLLEDKQGQYIEVRSVRHQMDAWLRSKLCSTPRKRNAGGKKEKHAQYSAPEVEPPWNANYSGGPSASTVGEDSSAVQEKLVILATAVQESNAAVNSTARQIVEEYSTPVPTAKGLKAAVDKMDKARKKLKDAEKARLTMHSSWRKYIADSLQRRTQFAEKFGRDDQELADRVRAAREKLQKTKEDVDAKKAALEDHDGEDHIDISDEDMAEKVDSSENIQSSLTHMVENLLAMKQQADAAIIEANENKAKRQRTDNNGDGELPAGGGFHQVTFAKYVEFYVGFEDTEHYVKETYAAENFNHQVHLREVTQRLFAGSEMNLEDEEASDEVSWMSAGVQQDQGELQPFLNRDATRAVDMPEVARQGDEVEMEIEAEISPSDPEDGSGSETDSSEGQEERHSTLAYFMDYDPVHCRPRWRTYELLHQDIAYQARMSHHDVSRINIVGHPPEDLQMASARPVIVQQPQDVTEGSTFQLILLDVEFHNAMPSLEAETVRRAKLLPKTISRKALLAVLGLQPFCTYARQACLMWHNRKPVKMQGRALIDLRHGDYLKIVVPPGRGELRKYYTREVAQCMRRGYRASNIPVILEANPEGIDVTDMPVYDTFAYVPKPEDLDYDKDAMALFQMPGYHVPPMDPWPNFLTRSCEAPIEEFIYNLKVGERDRQEARSYETSNGTQPEVGRPQLAFGNEQHFLQEFFPVWHHFAAVEREDEGRILYARTWYSDHDRFPACEVSRSARLTSDISSWLDALAETWDDRVDPDVELDFYLIVPRPRGPTDVGDPAVPHVLIVQHPRHDSRSVHVFAVDATDAGTTARSFVTVMPFPLRKSDFLDLLGIRDETFIESLVDCAVWHGMLNLIMRNSTNQDEPVMQTGMVAVRVKWLASNQPSPSYITLSAEATHDDAAAELGCWGLKALPVICNECGVVVCLSAEPCETLHYDYVFANTAFQGGSNMQDVIVHTDRKKLQINELMSVLYQLGFWRAIIESEEEIYPSVFKVCFLDQVVTINEKPHKPQKNVDWPKPQPTGEHTRQPFFHDPSHTESEQLVDLGVQTSDLHELFLSHQDILCPDFEGYELPEELQVAVDQCDPSITMEEIDRLLVYTDGSSLGSVKHAPPLRAEEDGTGDTWAYVIVGERYAPPGIKFIGWTAQQVHYDSTSNAHLGAKRLGADIAEKEALSWAALWRLSFNQKTPTCFRSDSRVALGQAAGTTGAEEMDETFAFLRGAFQAIEAALGRDGVQYQHVPGHAGEAWNEICDWLAKRERQRSFYCPRPRMDMRKWKAAMSHLWLIVGQHADLPRFCGKGLHAPAPQLPQQHAPAESEDTRGQTTTQQWDLMEFTVSACSANVNSLSGAPEGHGGRLDYLRSQFAMLGFNFLGVQESKTPEFHSCVNQVLRMSSGPGDYDGVAVHQTGFATSSGTSLLRSFAEEQGLFFPCTTTAHVGPTETWTDPTGEKRYCIDYVLLTHHFSGQCQVSRVVEEFDLGRTAWDHEATAVELQWQEWLQRRSRISPDGLGFDPEQINGQTVHSVLSTYAPPTWETNIEDHVGDFNKVLLRGLRQHCPPPRRGPKKAYMTEQSWQLRGNKLKFKKQIQQLFRRQRDERMIFFFKPWRHRRTDQKVWEEYQSYNEYLWRANFKLVGQHRKAMLQLRQHLSKAKQETIRMKFAEMDPNAPASAILHELKPLLGPSNLTKLKVSPLPQIRNAHGEACCLPNEAVEAWLEFFRQMEGGPVTDEMVMHVGRKLGFTEDLLEELYKHLSEPAAIAEANLPKHMQIAITALHEDTFFTVKGQGDVCRTTLGSRPGDCFADVIFSYLWGRILRRLQATLTDMQIDDKIPADTGLSLSGPQSEPSRSFLGPTWMDDTCVCVSDPSPQRLEAKIHQATGRLLDLCETHGLSPNLSPGKTEALLVFQGRGSRQMRIRYFGPTSDRSLKIMGEKGIMKVRAVAQYTHLGCVIHHQSDQRREARRRIGMAHQTFTQHRRHLLQNPVLSMQQAQANEELQEAARLEEQHACMSCQQTFRSKGGLGAHLFKKHGVISRLRLLFDTTCCGACLREYHTYSKLHAHLRHAAACREQLWGRRQRMAPVAGKGSVEDRELCNVHDGILPPLQVEGPCIAAGAAVALPEHDLCLAETIYEKVLERGEAEDIDSVILHSIRDYVIMWASCKATLGYLIENLTEQDLEILNLGEYDMVERLRQLQRAESWPFLCLTGSRPRHRASTMTLAEMEQQCLDAVEAASTRQRLWGVPRPMAKERFIIHAFSGRRRAGDFQHFIELIQKDYPKMLVHTISVDLMVDPTWGDVSQPKVRDFWLRAVKQRQVVGALAGPPCETWSQACGKELPSDPKGRAKRGPRIVRDLADLWGRAALALKEVRQLDVGNLLLLFTLELLIELALADGVGGLEHPAPPADETKASIWRLPLLQFIMEWPEFETLDISQGLWGAKSRKPTRLLLLNLKKMVPELRRWQLTGTLPTGVSIGLTDSGEWATSALKEYPPALCAGLASGFLSSLQEHPVEEGVEIDGIFRKQALAMVITQYGAGIGPDFAQ